MTRFYKTFCPFFSKSLPIHFKPSQNVSPISFLNGLMMVPNEGSIACKCFKKGNGKCKRIFALLLRISFIFEIFQISLANKKSFKFNLFSISKFKFNLVHGKMLSDSNRRSYKLTTLGTQNSNCNSMF